jgi:hypothetical protein
MMALFRLTETSEALGTEQSPRRDFQAASFGIDGISRAVCNTWEEVKNAQGSRGFDILIVGSGMYGGYVAAKLFEFGNALGQSAPRIVVLESGPFLISEHVQNLTNVGFLDGLVNKPLVGPPGQSQLIERGAYTGGGNFSFHARCVGGKSLFWGGWTPRLTEDDLRRPGSPWPKEVADYLLQPGVPDAEIDDGYPFVEWEIGASETTDFIRGPMFELLLTKSGQVFGQVQLDGGNQTKLEQPIEAPLAVQAAPPLSGLFSFDKYSSLPMLLEAVRQDSAQSGGDDAKRRLFLLPNANVLRVRTQNGLATGVDFAQINRASTGVPKDPNAPEIARSIETLTLNNGGSVILAGNIINSTRLALNSFRRPQSIFGPELMGRNLMYHVRTNHTWQVKRSSLGLPAGTLGNTAIHVPGTSRKFARFERAGRFHFQFYASANIPEGATAGPEDAEQYLYRTLPNFDQIQDILIAQDDKTVALGIRTCGETFGDRDTPVPTDQAVSWIAIDENPSNNETFVNSSGQQLDSVPRARVKLVESEEDKGVRQDQKAAAFKFIEKLTGDPQTGARLSYQDFINNPGKQVRYITNSASEDDGIGTTYHECGTLWMGDDPSTSVTDVHGRFHHLSSAYCADQALFPTAGSANPVPTGLALARKVARGITGRYRSSQPPGPEPGFESLFNGTFDGWSVRDANNFFIVKPGGEPPILAAGINTQDALLGVIWHERVFGDFELRLQWKIFSAVANGGVFVRAPKPEGDLFAENGFYDQTIEVQIDERGFHPDKNAFGSPLHRTGAAYERVPSNRWAARAPSPRDGRPGYWNDYVITVQGGMITVRLNGEIVSQGAHGSPRIDGHIGLQCHTEVVQYRSIRIRSL